MFANATNITEMNRILLETSDMVDFFCNFQLNALLFPVQIYLLGIFTRASPGSSLVANKLLLQGFSFPSCFQIFSTQVQKPAPKIPDMCAQKKRACDSR